jgi:hypothetical protein
MQHKVFDPSADDHAKLESISLCSGSCCSNRGLTENFPQTFFRSTLSLCKLPQRQGFHFNFQNCTNLPTGWLWQLAKLMARKQKVFEDRSDPPARLGIVTNARNPSNKWRGCS